jgi:hypothetical protein
LSGKERTDAGNRKWRKSEADSFAALRNDKQGGTKNKGGTKKRPEAGRASGIRVECSGEGFYLSAK